MAQSERGCSKYKTVILMRQIVVLPFEEECQFVFGHSTYFFTTATTVFLFGTTFGLFLS